MLMLLDKFFLIGEEDFVATVKSARENLLRFFIAIFRKEYNVAMDSLNILGTFPFSRCKERLWECVIRNIKPYLNKEYEDYVKHL